MLALLKGLGGHSGVGCLIRSPMARQIACGQVKGRLFIGKAVRLHYRLLLGSAVTGWWMKLG